MRPRGPTIAIDGPSGCGKSTVGRRVAASLGLDYLDTGAMYRAVALRLLREPDPEQALARAGRLAEGVRLETRFFPERQEFRIWLDGVDVTEAVRSEAATDWSSRVAVLPEVRAELVRRQREQAAAGAIVMEGRDIGTVVLPGADLKIYLDARLSVRARRRQAQEGGAGARVGRELELRDRRDSTRVVAPLAVAPDARVIDTSALDLDEVCRQVLALVARLGMAVFVLLVRGAGSAAVLT